MQNSFYDLTTNYLYCISKPTVLLIFTCVPISSRADEVKNAKMSEIRLPVIRPKVRRIENVAFPDFGLHFGVQKHRYEYFPVVFTEVFLIFVFVLN